MKQYQPPKRLVELGLVLQRDTESQELGKIPILTQTQRFSINQERAQLMSGNNEFKQSELLEVLIQAVLFDSKARTWTPNYLIF